VLSQVTNTTYRICKEGTEQTVNEHRLQKVISNLPPNMEPKIEVGVDDAVAEERSDVVAFHMNEQATYNTSSSRLKETDTEQNTRQPVANAAMYLAASTDMKW
jgi:hypothetical protein